MSVKLTLSASPALYECEEPIADISAQPESLTIGPFEWIQLTYDFLRVGARCDDYTGVRDESTSGEHVAQLNHDNATWVTSGVIDELPAGYIFSDVTIYDSEGSLDY